MKTARPKISVLLPVYNGEKYLKESIDSILQQTFSDFELLVISDGSTDESHRIIESYTDKRIRFIKNEKNKGLIFTLNRGLGEARGKYIARMDQDDISIPSRLQEQYDFLERNTGVALVGGWAEIIDENNNHLGYKRLPSEYFLIKFELLFRNPFIHSTIFFRKEIIQRLGGYNKDYEHAEDYELYSEMSDKYKIVNLPKILLKFRVHSQSIGQVSKTKKIQEITRKKIVLNNISSYYKPTHEDIAIINGTERNSGLINTLKKISLNKKIFKAYIAKEKLSKIEFLKLNSIYKQRNTKLIRGWVVSRLQKTPLLYYMVKKFYHYYKRLVGDKNHPH